MNDEGSIPDRVRKARELAQMEPAQLRARLRDHGIDLSKTGLHRVENTVPKNPNLKLIKAIAQITHVDPAWLLFGTGPAVPAAQANNAIRHRVVDTIELMAGALDLTARQTKTLNTWLQSVRDSSK